MSHPIVGLHHVTAIASDPQRNLDFYTQVLGFRFVKRTVNFDDSGTYHLYFGDDAGAPGTILTFFPWPRAGGGHAGMGEVAQTAFGVPLESMAFWEDRLRARGVPVERADSRFDEEVLRLSDPDGMKLEIIGLRDARPANPSRFADVPANHAIRGFSGVTLLEHEAAGTANFLAILGFHKIAQQGNRLRFAAEGDALGNHVDLLVDEQAGHGHFGAGSVHHIAFRAPDDTAQLEWRKEISKYLEVTPVMDRTYFQSIYFREPGGVLFELATDPPGFAFDEPIAALGEALRIPAWLEPQRAQIEKRLAPLELHKPSAAAISA